jgi:hypothetical protein
MQGGEFEKRLKMNKTVGFSPDFLKIHPVCARTRGGPYFRKRMMFGERIAPSENYLFPNNARIPAAVKGEHHEGIE